MSTRLKTVAIALTVLSFGLGGCTLVNGTDDWVGEEDPASTARPECIQYCDQMQSICVGNFAEYEDRNECLFACADMSLGVPGDYAVNTVQCRLTHLLAAPADPGSHCPHASEDGGGQCIGDAASPCSAYCANFAERCPAEFQALDSASPLFECAAECAQMTNDEALDDDYWYDSFQCRDNWLEEPGMPNGPFCEFARPDDPLGCNDEDMRPDCQSLCRMKSMRCQADEMECMMECGMVPEDSESIYCAIESAIEGRCMDTDPATCTFPP